MSYTSNKFVTAENAKVERNTGHSRLSGPLQCKNLAVPRSFEQPLPLRRTLLENRLGKCCELSQLFFGVSYNLYRKVLRITALPFPL